MRCRIVGMFIACVLCLAPARGFSYPLPSEWKIQMLDAALSEKLLKQYYGGSVSQFEGVFKKFLAEIRQAMLTNPYIRQHFWKHLQPILVPIDPTSNLTQAQFESLFISLVSSDTDFGWMAVKVLWPEEMYAFVTIYPPCWGYYVGAWWKGSAKFLFPANYLLKTLGDASSVDLHDSRGELAEVVIHEFLHHVARQMLVLHYVPETFFEQLSVPVVVWYPPNSVWNTIEHLWIYRATKLVPTLLGYVMLLEL